MQVVPFRADHVLDIQEAQEAQVPELAVGIGDGTLEAFVRLENGVGMNYTVLDADNLVAGCGGIFTVWPQRAYAWAIGAQDWRQRINARRLTRFACSILDAYPAVRIEATALIGFPQAHRWLEVLGFEMEAERMRKYDPMGRDLSLYARIRE